jgi:hypothetical protein
MKTIVWAIGLGLALLYGASAQDITGSILGTITDSSGGGVANAKVSVYSVEQQRVAATAKTNSSGEFVAPLLPVGTYNVSVEAAGFKKSVREGIALNVNDKLTVNARLEVGDVTQTVTVEEAPVQVQLQNATMNSSSA